MSGFGSSLWVMAVLGLASAGSALRAAPIVTTTQGGSSAISVNGIEVQRQDDSRTNSSVSVQAIHGSVSSPEARTAARSGSEGMAVNARLDGKSEFFPGTNFFALSQAFYSINVSPSVFSQVGGLDFVLPVSFLEVTSNAEVQQDSLNMLLFADLRVCFAATCGPNDRRFFFQAGLDASWETHTIVIQTAGDSNLDLAPLNNPTVTDVGGPNSANPGFLRTITFEWGTFAGHIDLGTFPANVPLTVEYIMQVRGEGLTRANIGLAGINDPFDLTLGAPLTLTLVEAAATGVPEPPGWALHGAALSLLLFLASRRRMRTPVLCRAA